MFTADNEVSHGNVTSHKSQQANETHVSSHNEWCNIHVTSHSNDVPSQLRV